MAQGRVRAHAIFLCMQASPSSQRAYWLKTLHEWHWVSSAICLVGMLLFALTGFTLNHAGQIEAKPRTHTAQAQLPAPLLTQLQDLAATATSAASAEAAVPASLQNWTQQTLGVSLAQRTPEWSTDELYIPLPRPGGDAWLRSGTAAPPAARPSLYEANARLTAWQAEGASVRFSLQGHAPLEFSLRDAGACQVRADGRALSPLSSSRASGPAARAYRLSHAAADIQVQCPAR